MKTIDTIYDNLTDIRDYIDSVKNPNNPSELQILNHIDVRIAVVQTMIEEAEKHSE